MGDKKALTHRWTRSGNIKDYTADPADLFLEHVARCEQDLTLALHEAIIEFIAFSCAHKSENKERRALSNEFVPCFADTMQFSHILSREHGISSPPKITHFVSDFPTLDSVRNLSVAEANLFLKNRKSVCREYLEKFPKPNTDAANLTQQEIQEIAVSDTSSQLKMLSSTLPEKILCGENQYSYLEILSNFARNNEITRLKEFSKNLIMDCIDGRHASKTPSYSQGRFIKHLGDIMRSYKLSQLSEQTSKGAEIIVLGA